MRTIEVQNAWFRRLSGWLTFKFSLPKQDSEKTNHKEVELAFHNRAYALLLYKSYSKNHHK
jgi:hypothetical protein